MSAKPEENADVEGSHEPSPISTATDASEPDRHQPSAQAPQSSSSSPALEEDSKKRGTHIMGLPADPTAHPDNQKAALWSATDGNHHQIYELPYLVYSPVEKPGQNSFELVINGFNTWSRNAETVARNIWHNLKTGPSVSEAAWGKVKLTVKAITEGGFEPLFKKNFATDTNEKLKKTFACYLYTATGPVAGTLYLSTVRVAFCSDHPLSFTAPSGPETWSYYKVMIPLGNIATVNPVVMKETPPESYIQIVTVDDHDFWFLGFVKFEKASFHLLNSTVQDFKGNPEPSGTQNQTP